jgi:Arc/MetJ-type ribon-helix-helix transcriptional regulator
MERFVDQFKGLKVDYDLDEINQTRDAFKSGDYKSASEFAGSAISLARDDFDRIQNLRSEEERLGKLIRQGAEQGVSIDKGLLKEVGSLIRKCDVEGADELMQSIRQSIESSLDDKQHAKHLVQELTETIQAAEDSISVTGFADSLNRCSQLLDEGKYIEARNSVETATEELENAIRTWEPDVNIEIPSGMVSGEWNKVTMTVSNIGEAHARDVIVQFEGLKQQEAMQLPSLTAGSQEQLEGALLPDTPGAIKVKVQLNYKRTFDDKELEAVDYHWIEIARPAVESVEFVRPRPQVVKREKIIEYRKQAPAWVRPKKLDKDGKVILELFTRRWECFTKWPDNSVELDYLHNNYERLAVSSYFEIPTDPSSVLREWGLPENIRNNVFLDDDRNSHILEVLNSNLEDNYVIIGEPGVGKTTLLFEIFDSLMEKIPTGILTTAGVSNRHLKFGLRLLYDDIPENQEMVQSLMESNAKGVIVTAREADWQKLPEKFQHMFKRLTVPLFSDEDVSSLCHRMLDIANIRYDSPAIGQLTDYAQGSPIFIWLMIKEMHYNGITILTKNYVKENSRKGMENYVQLILQKLLKIGPNYKSGGLHSLACMIFLSDYMKDRKCHELLYRSFADEIEIDFEAMFDDRQHTATFNQTIVYLSGEGSIVRFPHDTWADVLQGTGRMNPLRADIQSIKIKFAEENFENYKRNAVGDAWTKVSRRYERNSVREKDSFLSLADILTHNFILSELEEVNVDVEKIREVASINADLPIAARILSRIQAAKPTQITRIINIQDSVINRSTLNLDGGEENLEDSVVSRSG